MNREQARITERYLVIELKVQAQSQFRSVRGQLRAKRELGAGGSSEILSCFVGIPCRFEFFVGILWFMSQVTLGHGHLT